MEIDVVQPKLILKTFYSDDFLQSLMQQGLGNLNPRYALIAYNISLVKNAEEALNAEDFFDASPRLTIHPNHLFYHHTDTTVSVEDLGQSIQSSESLLTFHTRLLPTTKDNIQILFNNESIDVLDLSLISVELGIQLIASGHISSYCRTHQLDGYMTLTDTPTMAGCFQEVQNGTRFCPTLFVTNRKKEKMLNKFKILSNLTTTQKKEHLTLSQLSQLQSVMLCHLASITQLTPMLAHHLLIEKLKLLDPSNNKKSPLTRVFEQKSNKLVLLLLNSTNLTDLCTADVIEDDIIDIDNATPPIKDLEVFTSKNIHTTKGMKDYRFKNNENTLYLSEQVFDLLLSWIADKQSIHPFVFLHYHQLNTIPGYERLTMAYAFQNQQHIQQLLHYVEQVIVDQINQHYKKTSKGYLSNVNFTNLQYIPNTMMFMVSKILDVLNRTKFEDAVKVILGETNNKAVVKMFNVDNLYHSVINSKYDKPKLLLQDLLTDIGQYKKIPVLNVKFLKWIATLTNDVDMVTTFLQNIDIEIYDTYKQFISGKIQFAALVDFIGVESMLQYLIDVSHNHHWPVDLIIHYNTISLMPQFDNFKLKVVKKEVKTMEDMTLLMDKLKSKIMLVKLIDTLATHYGLDKNNKDVDAFLIDSAERIIKLHLSLPDSNVKTMINNNEFSWSDFIKSDINAVEVIQNLKQINTNDVMLSIIYKHLDKVLSDEAKEEILELIANRNLLQQYISYLKREFDKDTLSNVVLVQLNTKKNKSISSEVPSSKKSKSKKARKVESSEETEEMEETEEEYEPKKHKKSKR